MDFNDGMKKIYVSQTMGNFVETPADVVRQVFESLFRYKTLDLKWKAVWIGAS